jgi:hypothetical protein
MHLCEVAVLVAVLVLVAVVVVAIPPAGIDPAPFF